MIRELSEINWLKPDSKVIVLGAGPSLNGLSKDHFINEFDTVISVNWVWRQFDSHYNLTAHFLPTMAIDKMDDFKPTPVYCKYASDVQFQVDNFPAQGIRYLPYIDLWGGTSTIIVALHLATKINPKQVYAAGVDLKLADNGKMYVDGYTMENNKPSDKHFKNWAKVVKMQYQGLQNMTGCNFLTYRLK